MSDDDVPRRSPPKPKVFDGNPNHDKWRRSKAHEHRIAGALHGRRIARSGGKAWGGRWDLDSEGSGSVRVTKTDGGDIITPELKIEHKRTDRASIRLERKWLEEVKAGARASMKDPAIVLTFEQPGTTKPPEDWIAVPLSVWKRRTEE